jgi:hypothetical protein
MKALQHASPFRLFGSFVRCAGILCFTFVADCMWNSTPAAAAPAPPPTWPEGKPAADVDGDGISDAYESQIAAMFRPQFRLNNKGTYRPASLAFFLKNAQLLMAPGRTWGPGSVRDLLAQIAGKDSKAFKLQVRPRFDPEHSDAQAKQEKPTVFFRVFRPDPKTFVGRPDEGCEYVAIQYYAFCFFNDADFPANGGDHDGDILCLDFNLIVKAPAGHRAAAASYDKPILLDIVFHNHGRQLHVDVLGYPQLLARDGDGVQVFLEGGSNEPWPNAGKSGFGGWPAPPGFVANRRFEKSTGKDWPWSPREERIARPHTGGGDAIADYELLNLGEREHPMANELCQFVMRYAGQYGEYAPNPSDYIPVLKVLDIPENTPPEGPPFQPKMWDRQFAGAALPFAKDDGWLEYHGGDAPEKVKQPFK